MKILDAGTEHLPNIDVLHWIQSKQAQHAAEDAENLAAGRAQHIRSRPQNFVAALQKHERELNSERKYPYINNPTAYGRKRQETALRRLDAKLIEEILSPLEERYKGRGLSFEELEKTLGREQEAKSLTEPEIIMLLNHAPQIVELLQPMIENTKERFTDPELEIIARAVGEVLRVDEKPMVAG